MTLTINMANKYGQNNNVSTTWLFVSPSPSPLLSSPLHLKGGLQEVSRTSQLSNHFVQKYLGQTNEAKTKDAARQTMMVDSTLTLHLLLVE